MISFDNVFSDIIDGRFYSYVNSQILDETKTVIWHNKNTHDKRKSIEVGKVVKIDKKNASNAKLRLLYMYPIEYNFVFFNDSAASALKTTNFKSGGTGVPSYQDWKDKFVDETLLKKTKEHCYALLDVTAKVKVLPDSSQYLYDSSQIKNIDSEDERVIREKNAIILSVKEALTTQKDKYSSDSRFDGFSEENKKEYKAKIERLIGCAPMDAFALLCVLALIKPGDDIANRYALIKKVFDFFDNTGLEEYFEALWKAHCKGSSVECDSADVSKKFNCKNMLDLVEYYTLPRIKNTKGVDVNRPFSYFEPKKVKHVISGAGYGKTALLDILLLCNIFEYIKESNSIKPEDIKKYYEIRKSLFGDDSTRFFPIFIHSDRVNLLNMEEISKNSYSVITNLAEFGNSDVLQEALNKKERLLILIDAADEVQIENMNEYLKCISLIVNDYPTASIIQSSRPLGKRIINYSCEVLELSELEDNDIYSIINVISPEYCNTLREDFKSNSTFFRLAHNPLMLYVILDEMIDSDGNIPALTQTVEAIIEAIIDIRWVRRLNELESKFVKCLLGYLALSIILENGTAARTKSIGRSEIEDILSQAENVFSIKKIIGSSREKRILQEETNELLQIISVQSGILINDRNLEDHYLFQDPIIMDWLAAFYFKTAMSKNEDIKVEPYAATICWLCAEIVPADNSECFLSEDIVTMLVFCLVMLKKNARVSNGIFSYISQKEQFSTDNDEKIRIKEGIELIKQNSYGTVNLSR